MNARQQGFTLVEMLVVAVLGAVVMGAVYQTLTVEYRSNRQINAVVATQQTIRTSMQMLQSELREASSTGSGITAASATSITFRALRKVGFVCDHPPSDASHLEFYTMGGGLAAEDSIILQATRDPNTIIDDTFYVGQVNGSPSGAGNCTSTLTAAPWTSMSVQTQKVGFTWNTAPASLVSDIADGDAIRSFETITYALASINGRWVLGRQLNADTMVALIGPLTSNGLSLAYYDLNNNLIAAGSVSANLRNISRIQITITGKNPTNAGASYSDQLTSDIYLRGN